VGEPCDISLGFCTDVTDIIAWRRQQVVFESRGRTWVTIGAGLKRTAAALPPPAPAEAPAEAAAAGAAQDDVAAQAQ
jgi:hypothetical protein